MSANFANFPLLILYLTFNSQLFTFNFQLSTYSITTFVHPWISGSMPYWISTNLW